MILHPSKVCSSNQENVHQPKQQYLLQFLCKFSPVEPQGGVDSLFSWHFQKYFQKYDVTPEIRLALLTVGQRT